MRVGVVGYSNAYPLTVALARHELIFGDPTTLNQLFISKEFDLLLSSSLLCKDYPYLPRFCVAGRGKIRSVLLYTKVAPSKISTISFDPASLTSTTLAKILLSHHWQAHPTIVPQDAEAFCLIGDKALKNPSFPGYQTIDLATAWYEMTGLPFVFSLIFRREEVGSLEEEIALGLSQMKNKWEYHLQRASEIYGVEIALLDDYFKTCHYNLGPKEKEGLELFVKLHNKGLLLQDCARV